MSKHYQPKWILRYYTTTKSTGWHEACQSADPRVIVQQFDKLAGQQRVVSIELQNPDENWRRCVLQLGLSKSNLMKLATLGCRVHHRYATSIERDRFSVLRARGVKDILKGRPQLLDALVV